MKTLAPLLLLLVTDLGTTNPVTVTMVAPPDGSTVSNTITLSATASNTMGPITKVEFYVDGQLVGSAFPPISAVSNLRIAASQINP